MRRVLEYTENNLVYMIVLLGVMILAAVFWNLYRKEKRAAKRVREELKGGEKFYSSFGSNQKTAYVFVSEKGRKVLYVTPNLELITGIRPEDLKTDTELMTGLIVRREARIIGRNLETWDKEEEFSSEVNYHRNGEKELRRGKITIIYCKEESGYLLILSDITEEYEHRREMEQKLLAAQKESQSKTDFLSQMSHEIRTPMNGIIGMLTLAQGKMDNEDPAMQYIKRADELSEHLLSLINDILDMSRIEAGKVELENRPFSLRQLGDKLYDMFAKELDERGIHYSVDFEEVTADYVIGDELRISQIIINFLSNAVKFTKEGEITVTFRQMLERDGMLDLMICVHDTGIGMKSEFINRIFRPFEQEGIETAKQYGGTGLGMAITDQLVRLMGGEIIVKSAPGKGSDFSVFLHIPEAEKPAEVMDADAKNAEPQGVNEESTAFQGRRILLAEDNEVNAMIAEEILGEMGAEVEAVENGQKAVDYFKSHPENYYDFILMDVQMPVMNGRDAARTIRKLYRPDAQTIPIFALSADAFVEDERLSIESGMNGHYAKPVDFQALQKKVGMFLEKREKR